jgi:prolyl-tRNA editing enzyme YbaK/EbsC (Cys-tRNA(Pro) deacylase)
VATIATDVTVAASSARMVRVIGTLQAVPALHRPDLLAAPVFEALNTYEWGAEVQVAEIDPDLADTAAFCAAYDVPPEVSANCVVVGGRRAGDERIAACLVLATTRADVNGVVRRRLDVRKASFLPTDEAVSRTAMEFGGITVFGLPKAWPVLVDSRVVAVAYAIVGSGIRGSKLVVPGGRLAEIANAEVIERLAIAG